jgi:hypothetical protein
MKSTRTLIKQLRPLTALDTTTLARVAGGQSASTSTSGTPEAGDDTIGDSSGGHGGAGKVSFSDMHFTTR